MSDILKAWLGEEVGLEAYNIEQDFASGFMFGQVMQKYGMQPDFEKFEGGQRTPDAMVNNYTRLQASFQKLGIKFDSRTANSLMREEPGVALRLLYSMKQNLGQLHKDMTKFQHTGKLGKELGASVPVGRPLLDAQQHNTKKEPHSNGQQRFFEESMRKKAGSANALMESLHLRQYMEEMYRQERRAEKGEHADALSASQARSTFRSSQISKLDKGRRDKGKLLDHDDAVHASLMKRREELEREELRVALALSEKSRRKKLEELSHASLEQSAGIDSFEINMKRLVKGDAAADESGSPRASTGNGGPLAGSPLEHMAKMRATAVPTGKLLQSSQGYLAGVKAQREDDVLTKREREARRRKVLVEQQQLAEAAASAAQEDALIAMLARESAQEQALAERLWQVRQERDVMAENRTLREKQYAERREADWEATLMREREQHAAMRDAYKAKAAAEMEAWRGAQAGRAAEKAAAHADTCRSVAWQVVMLAERAAQHRERTGANVPANEFRRWLAMFVSGNDALGTPPTPVDTQAEEAMAAALARQKDVARATVVSDYLECSGEFAIPSEPTTTTDGASSASTSGGPVGFNAPVGAAVSDLLRVTDAADDPRPSVPDTSGWALRLAVVGAPFAGKSTMAAELASKFKLARLDVEALVTTAVAAAERWVPPEAEQPTTPESGGGGVDGTGGDGVSDEAAAEAEAAAAAAAAPPEQVVLGRCAAALLAEGADLPDDLLVSVLVNAVRSLGTTPVKEEAPAPPTKGGAKGKAKVEEPEEPQQGFVVDGFPRSMAQSVLLEKALTGLDLEREMQALAGASRVAPPPPGSLPQIFRPLISGLDAVLVLGLTDEAAALRRALGRRLDPQTGKEYHLEFSPPPVDDPGLVARLVEVADASNDAVQVQRRLAAYTSEAAPLDEWLKRFAKLRRPIDGFGPKPEVMASAADVAAGLLRAKDAVTSARASVEAATRAKEAAEEAQAFAEAARVAAEDAALELLTAKKAELAAAALLLDPKSKVQDAAATEVLKAQSAAKCAECLRVCKAAATESAEYAERARESAVVAGEAQARAATSLGDAEVNAGAEADARSAAEQAEAACRGAEAAAAKAEVARAAAEAAAAEAERLFAAQDVTADATLNITPAATEAAAAAAAAAADALAASAAAPPPVVALPPRLSRALLAEWRALEAMLVQPDGRDGQLTTFQHEFNNVDVDVRGLKDTKYEFNNVDVDVHGLKDTKAELMLRAEELRDSLWALCDAKMERASAEAARVGADSFVSDQTGLLGAYYTGLLQGYTSAKYGLLPVTSSPTDDDDATFVSHDLMSGVVPASLKDALDEKSKTAMAMPEWVGELASKTPGVASAIKIILASTSALRASLDPNAPIDPKATKAKGATPKDAAGKKGGKAEVEAPVVNARVVDTVARELFAGVTREIEMLVARARLIAVVNEASLHVAPAPGLPPPPAREKAPPAGLLSTGQLAGLVKASCADMADQVYMLNEVDDNKDGCLSRAQWTSVEIWFQYKAFLPGSEEDLDAEMAVAQQRDAYDRATALKEVLWDMFAVSREADGPALIDIKSTLLHLCPDRDMFTGIKKAFSVSTGSIKTNARASPDEVFRVVYPLGSEGGKAIHRSPFTPEDVGAVVSRVWESRKPAATPATDAHVVTAEQLMYSAGGERLVTHMLHRYQWKDVYVASKLL
ncbi:hypothetical protein FOA52_010484 [Chlamydomonas sp. UWO 241]|nr:hypothetical protein FOA52_010484 [Chlamydomonas sp. UWO 241]